MSASQSGTFNVQQFTDIGGPLIGGRLYTYAFGTTTHKTAYTDHEASIPHTYTSDGLGGQYIALNARGELPAPLYLVAGSYDLTLRTAAGATMWTRRADPVWDIANDLATPSGASLVGYMPAGGGAVATDIQSKNRQSVSIFDYLTPAHKIECLTSASSSDMTYAFTAAQIASNNIHIPAGWYTLNNFQQKNSKVFLGDGINSTFIKQGATDNPAWWCVSNAANYPVQILGAGLTGVWFLGKVGSTVASCIVEGEAPFVVAYSNFDFGGSGGYHTLEVKTYGLSEVYSCKFSVVQHDPDNRSGGVGSTNTGVVIGGGYVNEWWLNIVGAANGIGVTSQEFNSLYHHVITDCQQSYTGQANVIVNAVVEAWGGTSQTGAVANPGYNNRFLSITLTNVPNTSVSGYGVVLNNGSATITTILGYKVYGTYPGGAPLRPIQVGSLNSGLIADAETSSTTQKLEAYCTYDQLKNFTFSGDCSSLTNLSKKLHSDPVFVAAATYTLDANFATIGQLDETIYLNSSANCTITLPAATSCVGRKIYCCSRVAFTLVSASANILPLTGGPTPNILTATAGKWAILQAGTSGSWNVIANN